MNENADHDDADDDDDDDVNGGINSEINNSFLSITKDNA